MQLRDEDSGQVIQLDAIGPMSENCEGPITFPPGRHLDAITASYTLLGVISIVLEVDGNVSYPFGATGDIGEAAELTRWNFDKDNELVGLKAWQTSTAIR